MHYHTALAFGSESCCSGVQIITISFNDMELEESGNCLADSVSVYDGADTTSRLLGKFCGDETPGDLTSSGHYIYVVFRSNRKRNRGGFSLSWSAADAHGTDHAEAGNNIPTDWDWRLNLFTELICLFTFNNLSIDGQFCSRPRQTSAKTDWQSTQGSGESRVDRAMLVFWELFPQRGLWQKSQCVRLNFNIDYRCRIRWHLFKKLQFQSQNNTCVSVECCSFAR